MSKNKIREIKYYQGEEARKKSNEIQNKIDKYNGKLTILTEKLEELINLDNLKKGQRRKVVKLSVEISRLEVKIKRLESEVKLLDDEKLEKLSVYKKFITWFRNIDYDKQTMIWGVVFIIPWIIGMVLLFIPSLFQTFLWSFSETTLTPDGMQTSFVGLNNFIYLFRDYVIFGNTIFSVSLLEFIQELIIDLPIIIIFSILIAVLLNKDFKGHTVVKAIFFIPVIYNLAVITETLTGTFGQHIASSMQEDVSFVNQITGFFMQIGLGDGILEIVLGAVDRIFTIVNLSGIQILIFVAAIQSIPNHLYEAAEIEGATKYEIFWKITIPMIMPMVLTAAVYTVVDSFTRSPITRFLQDAVSLGNYGLGSAISISYFLINIIIIGIIFLIFRGRVFYHDEQK